MNEVRKRLCPTAASSFFTNKEVKILVHQKLQCENSGTSQPCYLVTPVSLCPQGFLKPSWGAF